MSARPAYEIAHEKELRRIGRGVRDGSITERAAHYFDGRATHAWSIIDGVVWRHERGPDGQRMADRRIGPVTS